MNSWKRILVIYDIEDNRVRNKVVKRLETYGVRVQKSAFECYVDDGRYRNLVARLNGLVGEKDSIRIYSTASECFEVNLMNSVATYAPDTLIV